MDKHLVLSKPKKKPADRVIVVKFRGVTTSMTVPSKPFRFIWRDRLQATQRWRNWNFKPDTAALRHALRANPDDGSC
jgi:hypothetical protein